MRPRFSDKMKALSRQKSDLRVYAVMLGRSQHRQGVACAEERAPPGVEIASLGAVALVVKKDPGDDCAS